MKKLGICLAFVLMLALLLTGCNDTPEQPSNDAPATEAPKEGCGSTVAFAAVALLTAAAAFVVRKKD